MAYIGQCACGTVSLDLAGEPIFVRQCWCRQCQQIAAGGPTNNATFKTEDVTIKGQLGTHAYRAESGNILTHYFCSGCATPIYAESSVRPHLRTVRLGVIDLPHNLSPKIMIWTDEAPLWAVLDPRLERHERQPPAPAV